jgi:hypothetical protein
MFICAARCVLFEKSKQGPAQGPMTRRCEKAVLQNEDVGGPEAEHRKGGAGRDGNIAGLHRFTSATWM